MKFSLTIIGIFVSIASQSVFAQSDSIDIYVDPGHGGDDPGSPGAYIPNYTEKYVNLDILVDNNYLKIKPWTRGTLNVDA